MKIIAAVFAAALLIGGGVYLVKNSSDKDMPPSDVSQENMSLEGQGDANPLSPVGETGEIEMQVILIKEGTGDVAGAGDVVTVHYTGWLEDDTKFDSSVDRGAPFSFVLGAGEVIRGWDAGVAGMKVGEVRKLIIPSELAYGKQGIPGAIPPNATLIFTVEMLAVKR